MAGQELRLQFTMCREASVPFSVFRDLLRVGGGLDVRGSVIPLDADYGNTQFSVTLEGTEEDLRRYMNYLEIAAVVIGEIKDFEWEYVDTPQVELNADHMNFVVWHWAEAAPEAISLRARNDEEVTEQDSDPEYYATKGKGGVSGRTKVKGKKVVATPGKGTGSAATAGTAHAKASSHSPSRSRSPSPVHPPSAQLRRIVEEQSDLFQESQVIDTLLPYRSPSVDLRRELDEEMDDDDEASQSILSRNKRRR